MARLDTELAKVSPTGTLGPGARQTAVGFNQLASGLAQVGSDLARIGAFKQAEQTKADFGIDAARLTARLQGAQAELAKNKDYASHGDAWRSISQKTIADFIAETGRDPDSLISKQLLEHGLTGANRAFPSVVTNATKGLAGLQRQDATEASAIYAGAFASSDDELEMATHLATGQAVIRSFNFLDENEKTDRLEAFGIQAANARLRRFLSEGDVESAQDVVDSLMRPGSEEQKLGQAAVASGAKAIAAQERQAAAERGDATMSGMLGALYDYKEGSEDNLPDLLDIANDPDISIENKIKFTNFLNDRHDGKQLEGVNIFETLKGLEEIEGPNPTITELSQLVPKYADYKLDGVKMLRSALVRQKEKTPFNEARKDFEANFKSTVTGTSLFRTDAGGDRNWFDTLQLLNKIEESERAKNGGQDPGYLYDPTDKRFLGPFVRDVKGRRVKDQMNEMTRTIGPRTIKVKTSPPKEPQTAEAIESMVENLIEQLGKAN